MDVLKKNKIIIGLGVAVVILLFIIPSALGEPKQKRDIQRKADIATIQKAVENFHTDNKTYPGTEWEKALTEGVTPYLQKVPRDPLTNKHYIYTPGPNGCSTVCTSYTLSAPLENKGDKQAKQGLYSVTSGGGRR